MQFRAPLLDRHVGVDIGRRVFRAQYALETAFALTAAALACAAAGGWSAAGSASGLASGGAVSSAAAAAAALPGVGLLVAASAILALEVTVVFPALEARGRHLIVAATTGRLDTLSERQAAYVAETQRRVEAAGAAPPAQMHLASVVLAFAKAALLGGAVWRQLLALAAAAM